MITDEMKTRAALAALNACRAEHGWPPATSLDALKPEDKADWLRDTTAALEAVAPLIRDAVLEEAASKAEDTCWAEDVEWWLHTTKKDASARSAKECAKAIRAIKTKETSNDT
jgi:hypothetical protein